MFFHLHTVFDILIVIILAIICTRVSQILILLKMSSAMQDKISNDAESLAVKNLHLIREVNTINSTIHRIERSIQALKEAPVSAQPIKPNNWQSIDQAFCRSVKVDE